MTLSIVQAKVMKKEEALQVKEKLRAEARAIKKGEACRRHEKHQRCLQQKVCHLKDLQSQ